MEYFREITKKNSSYSKEMFFNSTLKKNYLIKKIISQILDYLTIINIYLNQQNFLFELNKFNLNP